VVRGEFSGNLEVKHFPLCVSVCKFNGKLLIDPTYLEEKVINSKLIIGVREDNLICAIQKQGDGVFEFKEIEKILDLAIEKSNEIRRFL